MIFEAGPLKRPDGGIDADAIRAMIAARRCTRSRATGSGSPGSRSRTTRLGGRRALQPRLPRAPHGLPRPGSDAQLKRLSARIMQQHLDRARPLWEIWIVEGLEDDRFALISKVHHCMVDGVSGVDLHEVLMRLSPDATLPDEPPRFMPRPAPSAIELLRHECMRRAGCPLDRAARSAAPARASARTRAANSSCALRAARRDARRDAALGRRRRRSTAPIGPHRRFDWLAMDLADVKAVRKALGGSLNDVVLTVVTGAVRRFLERARRAPATASTSASWRRSACAATDERGALGNRVSAWIVPLPIGERRSARAARSAIAATTARAEGIEERRRRRGADAARRVDAVARCSRSARATRRACCPSTWS